MIDYHIHCNYSVDSEQTIDAICAQALKRELSEIAITDHIDIEYPYDMDFECDVAERNNVISAVQKNYPNLKIKRGLEIGITPHTKQDYVNLLPTYDLDFVILSVHVVDGIDPYYHDFFEGRTVRQAYTCYLEAIYAGMQDFDAYNVLGHIGYAARFNKQDNSPIQYDDYAVIFDKILKLAIAKGKGIEVNTKGIAPTGDTLPSTSIIRRYYQLGGKYITLGSDAHVTERVGDAIDETLATLKQIGFTHITTYDKLKPMQLPI